MKFTGTALAAILSLAAQPAAAQIHTAEVTGGTVEGEVAEGLATFKGIPFAAPPTGDLRWKPPQPVVPWVGTRNATGFEAACMQDPDMLRQMGSSQPMSEDCLYLDVWSPARSSGDKLPVIVWVHGGGYTGGAPSVALYDGAEFAREGVVFVSLAYRLGSFGFLAAPGLSAESGEGSGNYGMLDLVAGLEWVRDNIAGFGGDPEQVTIMGHSAGSSAVSILAASPLAEGLIDGVIAQSGANFAPPQSEGFEGGGLFRLDAAEESGARWLAGLGADTVAEARELPASALLDAQVAEGAPTWRPAVDGHVLPGDQAALWAEGRFADVPLLLGTTSNEWGALGRPAPEDFEGTVRADYGEFAEDVLGAYPHASPGEAERSGIWLGNEIGMESNAYAFANLHAENAESPVWYYWFDNAEGGSGHGSEVGLVFGNEDDRPGREPWDQRTRSLSERLQSYWVNFARTGNPNGDDLPQWPRYRPGEPTVMALGLETGPIAVPGEERLDVLARYLDWRREESSGE